MAHLDENTLTLYVLQSASLKGRRREINAHLLHCHGCRELERRIRAYYEEVAEDLSRRVEAPLSVRVPASIGSSVLQKRETEPLVPGIASRALTRVDRLKIIVYRHPVASAGAFLASLLLAFFGVQPLWNVLTKPAETGIANLQTKEPGATTPTSAPEPYTAQMNGAANSLEVLTRDGKIFWQIPVVDGSRVANYINDFNVALAQIADLDGDGHNEVVSGVPLPGGQSSRDGTVRVYDRLGNPLFERRVGHYVRFHDVEYPPEFSIGALLVVESDTPGSRDIVALAKGFRSPCCLVRLDRSEKVLGEYWTFGHMNGLNSVDLPGGGRGVVLCGVNDAGEAQAVDSCYPVVTVLDPARIVGTTESVLSRGFGYEPSGAEVCCIRFPRPDLSGIPNIVSNKFGFICQSIAQDGSLTFVCTSPTSDQRPDFFYTFDRNLRLQSLWLDSNSREFVLEHHSLYNTNQKLDEYLKQLEHAVRYWDGKRWVKDYVLIPRSTVARR
jgi:hypothetical protein